MLKEDFAIQANIRHMLTRTEIDVSQMEFGTVKGVVYIRGNFRFSRSDPSWDSNRIIEYTAQTLYSLEKKIRRIDGVSDVIFQLTNWRKEKGHWSYVKMMKREEKNET